MAVTGEEYELHGLVLAAGGSQRLGQPKQLLQVDDETLLHRACRQALVVCDEVTVVLGAAAAEIGQAISDLPLGRLINPDWQSGMASSIRAGITALPVTADGVLILPCDQPALTATDLQRLAASWRVQSDRIVAAAYDGIQGVPVIWPRDRRSAEPVRRSWRARTVESRRGAGGQHRHAGRGAGYRYTGQRPGAGTVVIPADY